MKPNHTTESHMIEVQNVWKRYGLPFVPQMRQWLDNLRNQPKPRLEYGPWALKGLDFHLRQGETLGIIGHNGAGKSTLLKVLAGVTPSTYGDVQVSGRVFPMIELNAGLHSEFTGRQNVYMLGAIMGLNRSLIAERIEDIKTFSELDEWFERPVRKYSSGMLTRLGFSVAIHVDAEILLVDEVLSVGDITFQRKCFDHMEKLQNDNATSIIFVSHSIRQVERLCERTIMLDQGNQVAYGATGDVVSEYYKRSNTNIVRHRTTEGKTIVGRHADDAVIATKDIKLINEAGEETSSFQTGDRVIIEVTCEAQDPVDDVIVGFGIATVNSFYVSGVSNESGETLSIDGETTFRCVLDSFPLLTGIYMLHIKFVGRFGNTLGGGHALQTFSVTVPQAERLANNYGLVKVNSQWIYDVEPQRTTLKEMSHE